MSITSLCIIKPRQHSKQSNLAKMQEEELESQGNQIHVEEESQD